jgi:hypothetical protein
VNPGKVSWSRLAVVVPDVAPRRRQRAPVRRPLEPLEREPQVRQEQAPRVLPLEEVRERAQQPQLAHHLLAVAAAVAVVARQLLEFRALLQAVRPEVSAGRRALSM